MKKDKPKKTKPKTCKTCDRWDGYAVRKEEQAGKKFRCLDPEAPKDTRKRPDGTCWRDGADPEAVAPESVTECACSGKEVLAIVEIPGDATPAQVDAAFDSLQSQLENVEFEGDSFPELDLTGPDEAEISRLIALGRESIAAGAKAREAQNAG